MKAEIINCFLKAMNEVLLSNTNIELESNGQAAEDYIVLGNKIGISIDLFGSSTIKGRIVLKVDIEIAKKIVSNMMGGMDVTLIDEIGISALGEFANWFIGCAAKYVQTLGEEINNFRVDIITPSNTSEEKRRIGTLSGNKFISVFSKTGIYEIVLSLSVD